MFVVHCSSVVDTNAENVKVNNKNEKKNKNKKECKTNNIEEYGNSAVLFLLLSGFWGQIIPVPFYLPDVDMDFLTNNIARLTEML